MVVLNSHGEVADILDVNQFAPGTSAFMCVPFAAALCKFAGEPGHGPSGTAMQASNLAMYWYGHLEGNTLASNTSGMSIEDEYKMLQGMRLSSHVSPPTLEYVKAWLAVGYPVLLCGAETGMYDIGLGDIVPYSWPPTGNHAVVASGVTSDGNLLVHDTANIGPTGVRTGPRIYDASKLQLVSATAIAVPWLPALPGEYDPTKEVEDVPIVIDLNNSEVASFFSAGPGPGQWTCKQTGKIVQGEILATYARYGNAGLCGLTAWGLPLGNEQAIGKRARMQFYERAVVCYDPDREIDNPPGAGTVYTMHLYSGLAQDPQIAQLKAQITAMQSQQAPAPSAYQAAVAKIRADLATLP